MPKTPAERAREYRARKKLFNQQKPPAQTATQRIREYRARQKALRNAAATIGESETPSTNFSGSRELPIVNPDNPQPSTSRGDGNILYDYLSQTSGQAAQAQVPVENAEERIVVEADVHHANSSQFAMIPISSTTTRTRKSCAQRCREYRQRKKAMEDTNAIVVQRPVVSPIVVNVSSNLSDIQVDPPAQVLQPDAMEIECDVPATSVIRRQSTATHVPIDVNKEDTYSAYRQHYKAHQEFLDKFTNNPFGHVCTICDRLWFKADLKQPVEAHHEILHTILPNKSVEDILACNTCFSSLNKNNIPTMSVYNGFKFPVIPDHLPPLDIISERLISPRIPFMQIRRLRHVNGQYGIYGQIINVPVCVNTMIKKLPRHIDDDHCINVHIKRRKIHRTSYLHGIVNKRTIKAWLLHLLPSPLYRMYEITVDDAFFNDEQAVPQIPLEDVSEHIPVDESLTAQQQTLLWNEDQYLRIAPGERNLPSSLLFDEHAEELSFPAIYLGQFRTFREGVRVTPFTIASSELRRSDRRATTPYHLLYMAMKIMRLRVRDSITVAFKHIGKDTKVTRQQIQDEEYINNCIEQNLAFLRSIPNSAWYWSNRKKDLFAMIRQLGKPTIFLTMSANEIGWTDLLRNLYKLKHGREISDHAAAELNYMEKTTLVNDDAVTCAIHFNKLVNMLIRILESKKFSPFGKYYVVNYFKRIEFQHRGSPHAHILLWLANAPSDAIRENKTEAVALIDQLISVSSSEASGNIKLQKHKHTSTCYKKIVANRPQQCRFEAPFMPCRNTSVLTPMLKEEPGFQEYYKHYRSIHENLEKQEYGDMDDFYAANNIPSDDYYQNVLRAGIKRPRVFIKRQPYEKWNYPFNPFMLHILKSNMDIQFITDEYSCAAYVAEYVNKTNRGVSNLQRLIIQTMDEHPEFDVVDITRNIGINMLNTVEMTSQEAAWYLLREPMSKSSTAVIYIPTTWPIERQRVRKTNQQLNEMGIEDDSTNIWKENWFDKYENRHPDLEAVTLAQFVANYTIHPDNTYTERKIRRIIRYRNFDMAQNLQEYKREMVSLHFPFRNEETEVLSELKFVQIYNDNEDLILNRRKEFESNLDIQKTMEICQSLCREDELENMNETQVAADQCPDANPFQQLYNDPRAEMNADITLATLNRLGPIAKKRENLMSTPQFYELMRMANKKQGELLRHVISNLLSLNNSPFQIFLTGPAGCGKTFVIKLIMEIYNRFTNNDGICNAYITCASTGKAAVAIDGTTVHTALKISLSNLHQLHTEDVYQYRALFKYVKVLIIDEISMISAELLGIIDARLKQITGNFNTNFGGLDMILIGDLRQLPPVRATPIYKQIKQRIHVPLWQGLKFFQLDEVMRQANRTFASVLTKIGNGEQLDDDEIHLIEARFFTQEEANRRSPHGIRLFNTNQSVNEYNNSILNSAQEKIVSTATDIYTGCHTTEQEAFVRQKLHKMSLIDTAGLPYQTIFVKNVYYMITTNIDVADGLANGAVGKLVHIDYDNAGEVSFVWLDFPDAPKTGQKIRKKCSAHMMTNNISKTAVPIARRSATIPLNNNKTINAKRTHFPVVCACASTIHKSQGGTYSEIVYEYDKKQSQSLVYVALSRVTSIDGLFIITRNNDLTFYHGRRPSTTMTSLQAEFRRLSTNCLETLDQQMIQFIQQRENLSIYSFNCQSLRAHATDVVNPVMESCNVVVFHETWLAEDEAITLPNFNCIIQCKRSHVRAGGVAIYHNKNDTVNVLTPHVRLSAIQSTSSAAVAEDVGDICISVCRTINGQSIIIVGVYITPNSHINDIIAFLHGSLLRYTCDGGKLLPQRDDLKPLILTGDFNVNFASDTSIKLIDFLQQKLNLQMNNDRYIPTTKSGTTIDAVFSRYIDTIESRTYISYFSYHKPIVSTVAIAPSAQNIPAIETPSNVQITVIN